jgi:hypothetical protein
LKNSNFLKISKCLMKKQINILKSLMNSNKYRKCIMFITLLLSLLKLPSLLVLMLLSTLFSMPVDSSSPNSMHINYPLLMHPISTTPLPKFQQSLKATKQRDLAMINYLT